MFKLLEEELKKEEDPEKRDEIKNALMRLKQQLKAHKENEKKDELKAKIKQETFKDAKEGKKPHFINKSRFHLVIIINQIP